MATRTPSPARRRGPIQGAVAARALSAAFELVGGRAPSPPPPPPRARFPAAPIFPAFLAWAASAHPVALLAACACLASAVVGALMGGPLGAVLGAVTGGGCGAALASSLSQAGSGLPRLPLPALADWAPPTPDSPGARQAATLEAGTGGSSGAGPTFSRAAPAPAAAPPSAAPPSLPHGQTRMDRFIFVSWAAPRSPEIKPA